MKIAIVGCGKKKKQKGKHKAKKLYTSLYSRLRIKYAEQKCDQYYILSAKHGLLTPETRIEPYDKHIKELEAPEFDTQLGISDSILEAKDSWPENTEVVLLAGKEYIQVIEKRLPDFVEVEKPFEETNGIGEQIKWLKDNTDDEQQTLKQVFE